MGRTPKAFGQWPRRRGLLRRLLDLAGNSRRKPSDRDRNPGQAETLASHLLGVHCRVATHFWRLRGRLDRLDDSSAGRAIRRHAEAALDDLQQGGLEISDPTGQDYVTGLAVKVLQFQPTEGAQRETIAETIRPAVYFQDKLIQRAEVIVETPAAPVEAPPAEIVETDEDGQPEETDPAHPAAPAGPADAETSPPQPQPAQSEHQEPTA